MKTLRLTQKTVYLSRKTFTAFSFCLWTLWSPTLDWVRKIRNFPIWRFSLWKFTILRNCERKSTWKLFVYPQAWMKQSTSGRKISEKSSKWKLISRKRWAAKRNFHAWGWRINQNLVWKQRFIMKLAFSHP